MDEFYPKMTNRFIPMWKLIPNVTRFLPFGFIPLKA
jgi:hypothetical protein